MAKRTTIVASILLLAALAACSGGKVILNVDIHSFLTNSGADPDPFLDYAFPLLPIPIRVNNVEVVGPTEMQMVEAIGGLTVLDSGSLDYRIEAVNLKGRASAEVHLRLAATQAELAQPISIANTISMTLGPDSTSAANGSFALDARTLDLFTGTSLWMSMDMDVDLPPAQAPGDSLVGTFYVRELSARIVADEDFF